ncbi:hypothetical protein GGQ92_000864 [Gracilibacillus halotolerans]|uniref:Cellobiose phosphorylase n=1 Tax=Gracilibacillus halotolerans TaxID=74386 RepID=A0A841RKC5_9BACI|nr:hypothetical protein [Gracilibacillus halotolerans]MBB6512083.1 hypothetical protein [Gracilibacillus halotolerans]
MYKLLNDQTFRIENYQTKSPFSSFLPGLAGEDGIPMWVFYVNRGQGIASFGVENKDNAMTEFYPADKAYQMVPLQGFRTFIKGKREGHTFSYEAFNRSHPMIKDSMEIGENWLEIQHHNTYDQLLMDVTYYNLPNQSIPGLIREVTIQNESDNKLKLELMDGLATLFPPNVEYEGYKSISHTLKSWFDVQLVDQQFGYYFMRGSTADEAKVSQNEKGNFYVSLLETKHGESLISPVYDRNLVFGDDLSLRHANYFEAHPLENLLTIEQVATNKTSCGFTPVVQELEANESIKLYTVIGQVDTVDEARNFIKNHISSEKFKSYQKAAIEISKDLTQRVETKTAITSFDAYVKQNFLDNGLRGGFPIVFENDRDKQVFYLYSRKHGDLERDYNYFTISASFYSQGNGNYRDMNQNRRLDVLLEPRVEDKNIKHFVNLIQLDGYNPLAIKTVSFSLNEKNIDLTTYGFPKELYQSFLNLLTDGYTPGDIKSFMLKSNVKLSAPFEVFLTDLLTASDEVLEAEHGEGFWIDHWTYNLDLIDSYLAIYPDKLQSLFFEEEYRFYDSPAFVNPQESKYEYTDGKVRQYNALTLDEPKVNESGANGQWLRANNKKEEIFTTNLFSKLFLLAANKTSTIAPYGLGIEMEAGKPGWNDALNGLPGMLGAGVSELYELKRLLNQLNVSDFSSESHVSLPKEAGIFIENLSNVLTSHGDKKLDLTLWKKITEVREAYRASILNGITDERFTCSIKQALNKIRIMSQIVDQAIQAVESFREDLVPTYFYFEAEFSPEEKTVTKITPHAVLPFLEGIVKQMKLANDVDVARSIYEKVKQSDLYDKKLGMYKTSVSIKEEPIELGRAKFFTPGWLENESIFLHMAYKYLLELLKSGLYDEFFEEIKTGLVVFHDPAVYGRSILENSSFIVSSANPDPSIHGKGFIARLSGSTIEFLHMWFAMFVGQKPFRYENEQLIFQLDPKLPSWLFTEEGNVRFKLFSSIDVTYENKQRNNTYGEIGVKPVRYTCILKSGEEITIENDRLIGELAEKIRSKSVASIHVQLA